MKITITVLYLMITMCSANIPVSLYSQETLKKPFKSISSYSSKIVTNLHRNTITNIPAITSMVSEVNSDTIYKTLFQLQNWGSRFALNENRKDIALWLMNKFLSYGYTDVKLDSFFCISQFPIADSTMQYNVVCTLQGTTAKDKIYIIGAHYDSYSTIEPYTNAPGIDDNGSGTAATLEIARTIAKMSYQPKATIQFILFAAEELGKLGSEYLSNKAKTEEQNIQLMYALDMISYNPENTNELSIFEYPGFEWASGSSSMSIERYTDLSVVINKTDDPGAPLWSSTDSYSYYKDGYPTLGCWEPLLTPYYHTAADTIGNSNVSFVAKVARGVLSAVAEQQLFSYPQNLTAHSDKNKITLHWNPTQQNNMLGFNVFRSVISEGQYQKLTPVPISDTIFHDFVTAPNKEYYYVLTSVNDALEESGYSKEVSGARFNFSDTLLVLASLRGNQLTPDSILEFYHAVIDTIPFVWYDLNAFNKISPGMISRYRSILWMTNSLDFEVLDQISLQRVSDFTANGGNLIFAGFIPMKLWMDHSSLSIKISETEIFHNLFKIDSVRLQPQSLLFRSNSNVSGYDTLHVHELKNTVPGYPGQINNIEVFAPSPDAGVIYRFDSEYNSNSALGKMKNRPVGLEYIGSDFKSILLSFPLYYIDTHDAKKFLHYVMAEKFSHSLGSKSNPHIEPPNLTVYPNPFQDICKITIILSEAGKVKLTLVSAEGQLLKIITERNFEKGTHCMSLNISSYKAGVYLLVMENDERKSFRKILKL